MSDLIDRKMLTAAQAEILATVLVWRQPPDLREHLIGEDTLANVLAVFIPDGDRILILEDVAELSIRKPHVVSAEAQLDTHKSQIGFSDLLKAVLRHRPDRIIVGEVRGAEARVFLDALNTGHRGSLSTIHANSAEDTLRRLAQLAMRSSGEGIPLQHVEEECRRSIDLVVHVVNQDGWCKIIAISTPADFPVELELLRSLKSSTGYETGESGSEDVEHRTTKKARKCGKGVLGESKTQPVRNILFEM